MKILLVGGFLGSGKTSFILKLAHHMIEDLGISKIVILENEIGEISVDDKVLGAAGYEVRGLFSGCVCCTLAGELPPTIRQIEAEQDPEWLIMEATGVAFPSTIRNNLKEVLDYDCHICCLVDAQRWNRLYKAMAHLFTFQLQDAELILVNKADLVEDSVLKDVMEKVQEINPEATVTASCANESIPEGLLDPILKA